MLSFALFCVTTLLTYEDEVGGKKSTIEWKIEEKGNELEISGSQGEQKTLIRCDKDYHFQFFSQYKGKEGYEATLKGKQLAAKLTGSTANLEKTYSIDQSVWLQQLGFGLQSFAQSGANRFLFSILKEDDLTLNKLVATRLGSETLTVGKQTYQTDKFKITLQGFKKMFWTAYIWFDQKTHWMVRYQGDSGPNTPVDTQTLIEVKSS